jgi:hypothetical protein
VRPDGYVALANPDVNTAPLTSYLDARELFPAPKIKKGQFKIGGRRRAMMTDLCNALHSQPEIHSLSPPRAGA